MLKSRVAAILAAGVLAFVLSPLAKADTVLNQPLLPHLSGLTITGDTYDVTFGNGASLMFTSSAPQITVDWTTTTPTFNSDFYAVALADPTNTILASLEILPCGTNCTITQPIFGSMATGADFVSFWATAEQESGGSFDSLVITPEPGSLLLLGMGLLAVAGISRRKVWV